MSTLIKDGSHVIETFASDFKSLMNVLAIANAHVNMYLNVQDGEGASMMCRNYSAYEYIAFMHALEAEISTHGVAIVVATDYRPDTVETTIFVVCNDD